MGASAAADPVDRRATPSGERVSYGERWSSSEGESSTRSYSDVVRAAPPPTGPPADAVPRRVATVPGRVAPIARPAVKDRLGPRSEVHRESGGPVLDADGFQHPRRRHHHRRPRHDAPPSPASSPHRRSPSPEEVAGLCFRCPDHRHRVRDCPNDLLVQSYQNSEVTTSPSYSSSATVQTILISSTRVDNVVSFELLGVIKLLSK
ncbi:hypothetical protein D1007_55785 [Hordeum vulgare]|nr:hypothetical protein D1007_55785 [Hordeum vulgare]